MATLSAQAINKFFYYSLNYKSDYITYQSFDGAHKDYLPLFFKDIVWTCNTAHIVGKWNSVEDKDCYGRLNRFLGELDSTNKNKVFEWIMDNYNEEPKLQ